MSEGLPDEISVDGVTLVVSVERKRVKNVNARLRGSALYISAPPEMARKQLEPAIEELARRLLRRVHARELNAEEEALKLARKVAQRFVHPPGVEPSVERVLFVTNQRSRWGSYSTKTRTIRLNAALRGMPGWVLEAVVAHELAHVIHPDHSPAFWNLLKGVCPESDRANAFLEGVSWLGHNWEKLPPLERTLLTADKIGR
jgi:predicted metal-dependent hydrolase